MPGLLSQALDNLSRIEPTIRSVQVPPSSTQQIQEGMLAGLDQLRAECGSLRDRIAAYATPALAHLSDIGAQLSAAQPPTDRLSDELRQVQAEAQGISAQAEDVFTHAKTILDNQNAYQQQLNDENQAAQSSYNELQSQASALRGEIEEAQSSRPSAWEELFLPGGLDSVVSEAAAQIVGLQNDLDEAESELQETQMEMTYQQTIIQATTDLSGHTSQVVDILSGIRNTLTIVTSDLDHLFAAHPDLDKTVVLRLFVTQATSEMQSLIADAS
jgi:chromosome segregation ATPase